LRKLLKNTSLESDLNQAADDLQQVAGDLLGLSFEMIQGCNEPAAKLMEKMILSVKKNESILRSRANSLKNGRLGRRSGD
jgi:hypothetical protein